MRFNLFVLVLDLVLDLDLVLVLAAADAIRLNMLSVVLNSTLLIELFKNNQS